MGVPTPEVGYTLAMPRREDHEVHKGHVVALDQKNKNFLVERADITTWGAAEKRATRAGGITFSK